MAEMMLHGRSPWRGGRRALRDIDGGKGGHEEPGVVGQPYPTVDRRYGQ